MQRVWSSAWIVMAVMMVVTACSYPGLPAVAGDDDAGTGSPTLELLAGSMGGQGNEDGRHDLARFNGPAGIVVDTAHNLYIADGSNATICKISAAGGRHHARGHRPTPPDRLMPPLAASVRTW